MGLWDLITVLLVFGTIGFVILAKVSEKKPHVIEWIKDFMPKNLYDKTQPQSIKEMEKMQQVWNEKRSMI